MKNITLSANEELIDRARLVAMQKHTTLNEAFREWLAQFTGASGAAEEYRELMDSLSYVDAGRHFTREELNER